MYDARPLPPEDQADEAEFGQLTLNLLRELAAEDPAIAERVRERGIELDAPAG